ncbi:MAG: hypothetical protein KGL44_03780 [Sphingomonadales bacterium]|nr:hypothetical protein [Sphingomonadales bacterium]
MIAGLQRFTAAYQAEFGRTPRQQLADCLLGIAACAVLAVNLVALAIAAGWL